MDTLSTYRHALKQILLRYAELRPSHGDIRLDVVFDEPRDRYALMQVGWDRGRRVKGNLIYVTLRDEKVYIEYDGLEHGITDDLTTGGIPPDKIVLAFLPEPQTAAVAGGKAPLPESQGVAEKASLHGV